MAELKKPETNGFRLGPTAPAGAYIATCLDIQDQFGVERPKFENPSEMETLDVTRFLFGFKAADGQIYKVQTYEMRISGNPKSNLFKFLTAWLGELPKYGWDYCGLKGRGAMITVRNQESRDGSRTYASIVGIAPVMDQLKDQVLKLSMFATESEAVHHVPPGSGVPAAENAVHPRNPAPSWNADSDPEESCPF
jgi:hypothetical protein